MPERKALPPTQDCDAEHQLDPSAVFPYCKSIPYTMQKVAYRTTAEALEHSGGAILATDPGTGKTFITLALVLRETRFSNSKQNQAILVKSPLIEHWKSEVNKHVNASARNRFVFCTDHVTLSESFQKDKENKVTKKTDKNAIPLIYVVPPHVACRSKDFLEKHWKLVAIDEAHTWGNTAVYFKSIFKNLVSEKRLLVTASPKKDWPTMSQMLGFEERIFKKEQEKRAQEEAEAKTRTQEFYIFDNTTSQKIEDTLSFEIARLELLAKVTCTGRSLHKLEPCFRAVPCEPLERVKESRQAFDCFKYERRTADVIWCNLLNLECLPEGPTLQKAHEMLQQECHTGLPTSKVFCNKDDDCSICMSSFKDPRLISCGHVFCARCWGNWLDIGYKNGSVNCPCCGKPITENKTWIPIFPNQEITTNKRKRGDSISNKNGDSISIKDKKMIKSEENQVTETSTLSTMCKKVPDKRKNANTPESKELKTDTNNNNKRKKENEVKEPPIKMKDRCPRLYDSVSKIPKIIEFKNMLRKFFLDHEKEQMIVFTKEFLYAKYIQHFVSTRPNNGFQHLCKSCGFDDAPKKKVMVKINRRLEMFKSKKIQILCLNIADFASGHDFPEVENVAILDFDTTTHLYQARLRAGCARIHSKQQTDVTVFVNSGSIQEFVVKYLLKDQKEVSRPCHGLMLQLEHFMLQDVPNTRMYRLQQHLNTTGAVIQEFQGKRLPTVKITLPNLATEVLLLRKFQ